MSLSKKMGEVHERFLVNLFGGRKTKASGAVWNDQMDGRHSRRDQEFAFAWDGKSTLGKSIGVSRAMWEKAREQAAGERPMLALRWYENERLDVGEDLVVLGAHDFAEMLEKVNQEPPPIRFFGLSIPTLPGALLKKLPPNPLLVWDDKIQLLDEFTLGESMDGCPEVVARFDGGQVLLPEDRVIEIYINNSLKSVLWPGQGWRNGS